MPNGDGTGPDGNGPKKTKRGWPERSGQNQGRCRRQQNNFNRNFQGNKQGRRNR